jgi:hypothetical protein
MAKKKPPEETPGQHRIRELFEDPAFAARVLAYEQWLQRREKNSYYTVKEDSEMASVGKHNTGPLEAR